MEQPVTSDETDIVRLHIPNTRGHDYGGDFKVETIEPIGTRLQLNLRYVGNAQVKRLGFASISLAPEVLLAALRAYDCKRKIADETESPSLEEDNDPPDLAGDR